MDKCHTLKEVRHFSRGALFEVRKSVYSSKCVLSLLSAISSSHFQTFSCLELATPHLRTIYRLKRAVAHRRPRIGFDGVAILGVVVFAAYTLANAHYETDIGDAECAANVPPSTISLDQSYITKEIVRTLNQEGVVVIKNVLQRSELISARAAAMNVLTEGRLNYAGGNSISVRQDKVCFVRGSDGTAEGADKEARGHSPIGLGLQHCISLLRGTTQRLQELGYDRSINHKVPMQCQLAHYAGNGNSSYTAHRDAASDTNFYEIGLLAWCVKISFTQNMDITVYNPLYFQAKGERLPSQEYHGNPVFERGGLGCLA